MGGEREAPVVTGACPEPAEGVSPVVSQEAQDAAGDGGYYRKGREVQIPFKFRS